MEKAQPLTKVLKEVKEAILPARQEEKKAFSRVHPIIRRIKASIPNADVILGGSAAKGTWLRTFDVDVFVMFHYRDYEGRHMDLSDILERALRRKFGKVQRLHGSRDYFRISENGFTFEVIPILKISRAEQAKNITDISPLHTKWVRKSAKLANEIRLTKQFAKSNNLYGAESYIRGFSGYVCEILTIHCGSFQKLLKAAAAWKNPTVVDAEGYYRKKNVFLEMNKSKRISPLIVIYPVQHDRNAAAALSLEKFSHFVAKAGEFLKSPSPRFFLEKTWDKEELKRQYPGKRIILVCLSPLEGKDDVVGSKMMKAYEHILQQLSHFGFSVAYSDWEWNRKDDALLLFVFGKKPLSEIVEREGPPLFAKSHVGKFRKMHKKTITKNKRLYAIEKRPYTLPEQIFPALISDEYVRERARSSRFEVL